MFSEIQINHPQPTQWSACEGMFVCMGKFNPTDTSESLTKEAGR